ncbi:MAG TPA: class II aldolase/adducin family protein [Acidimicrobiales bacterium]
MREADARRALVEAVRRLDAAGLNLNSTGNLSVRVDDGLLVTPSGIAAAALQPGDCVVLGPDGTPLDSGARVPTSEWRLHVAVLASRPEVEAVVHTHSPEATAAAILGRAVPAVHYVVARFGGSELPCAPYATYGSPELAAAVAATLGERGTACLMANHGAVTLGRDIDDAVALAFDVEWFCGVHRRALGLGRPVVLDEAEIARVTHLFETYGQPRP